MTVSWQKQERNQVGSSAPYFPSRMSGVPAIFSLEWGAGGSVPQPCWDATRNKSLSGLATAYGVFGSRAISRHPRQLE
jgi:hypothetical protein